MAVIAPFQALLFRERGAAHCCPPYDIISPALADHLHDDLPANAIRLELPRGDGDTRYDNARKTLDLWLADGTLTEYPRAAYYVYEEEFDVPGTSERRTLRGLIARVKLEEFSKGIVLPHEETLSKAKEDRFRLMRATGCNFSHIYSLYVDDEHMVTPVMDSAVCRKKPDTEFVYEDGVTQRLWMVEDALSVERLTAGFKNKKLYIADGHHRYETGLRYRDTVRQENGTDDAGAAEYIMMTLVDIDSEGLVVLPTHRELFGLEMNAPASLEKISALWDMEKIDAADAQKVLDAAKKVTTVFVTPDGAWKLTLKDDDSVARELPEKSAAYCALDVAALHTLILDPVFGIDAEALRTQKNLRYTRSASEAIANVKDGACQAAFLIRPTRVRQIKDVAQAGDKMPQKSTYFYPKIITGLVMNRF